MLNVAIVVCTCTSGVSLDVFVRRPNISIITVIHIRSNFINSCLRNDVVLMEWDAVAVWLFGLERDDVLVWIQPS